MSSDQVVIYHADCDDGFTGAWVAHTVYPDAHFVAARYGETPPNVKGKNVFIIDFSYDLETMQHLQASSASLILLDHHKTAAENLAGKLLPREQDHITIDMDHSGAMLAWLYFRGDRAVPQLVQYVEDRDLWRKSLRRSDEVSAAIQSLERAFDMWDDLYAHWNLASIIDQGFAIRRYQRQVIDYAVKNAHPLWIAEYKVKAANANCLMSEIGHELSIGQPFGAVYQYYNRQWRFSLRSDDNGVDVSAVAKRFGGGGHAHASGFEVKKLSIYEHSLIGVVMS